MNQRIGVKKSLICVFSVVFASSFYAASGWTLPDSRDASEWFERAHSDLAVAKHIHEQGIDDSAVCFHSHQAVEKLLKGLAFSYHQTPERSHDTAKLIRSLLTFEPRLKILVGTARSLDRVYIPSRYPKQGGFRIGEKEAEDCLSYATPFFGLIEAGELRVVAV